MSSSFHYRWNPILFTYEQIVYFAIYLCMGAIIQANSNQQIIKLPSPRYVETKMKINYNFLYGYCLNCFVSSRLVMRIIWCWCKWCKMIILSLFFNCYEMTSKSNENISATQKNCLSFWFQYTYSRIINLFLNVSNVCSGYIMWKYELFIFEVC